MRYLIKVFLYNSTIIPYVTLLSVKFLDIANYTLEQKAIKSITVCECIIYQPIAKQNAKDAYGVALKCSMFWNRRMSTRFFAF